MTGLTLTQPECWTMHLSGLWSAGRHGLVRIYHVCRAQRGHRGQHHCGLGGCQEIWKNETIDRPARYASRPVRGGRGWQAARKAK